ncbi:MAG: hypothetical protein AABY01_00885 [Nanoarchaeota archaeon]
MKQTRRTNATPREQGRQTLLLAIFVMFVLATALFLGQNGTPTGMFTAAPVEETIVPEIIPAEPLAETIPAETSPEETIPDTPVDTPPVETSDPETAPAPAPLETTGFGTEGFSIAATTVLS